MATGEPNHNVEEAQLRRNVEVARDPLTAVMVRPIIGNILFEYADLKTDADRLIDDALNFLIDTVPQMSQISVSNYVTDIAFSQFPIGKSEFPISKIRNVIDEMKGRWIIAIDESMVDEEMFSGEISYRHSSAFGMRIDDSGGEPKEKILALSSVVKIQEEERFKDKMAFVSYLMNLYVAYYTAKFLISIGEKIHSIILHGPLIRQLGPYMELGFEKDLLKRVFSLGKEIKFEQDISDEIRALATGELLQQLLNSDEYKKCKEQLDAQGVRLGATISGVSLYLCLIKRIYDFAKKNQFFVIGCVEAVRSSEYTDIYFRYQVESYYQQNPNGKDEFERLLKNFSIISQNDVKIDFLRLREKAGWDDEKMTFFGVKYDASQQSIQYTNPVPIRRYFSAPINARTFDLDEKFSKKFSSTMQDAQNVVLFNMLENTLKFPDYKVLMSYVRTSELKAPIRVEFFETGNWKDIVPFVYAVSQPYSSFGLPVFLYFADKIARVPKSVVSTVTKELLMKKAVEYVSNNPQREPNFIEIVNALLNKFRRDFTER